MNSFLKSLARKAGYSIAALIIIAAVFVCIVRLLTPVLDDHRADFEKLASQFLQTPVTIKNVRVSWYQYQPVIRLNNVTILNQSKTPILQIKKVSIFVSIIQSLWQWKFVTSGMMASGTELNISKTANGEFKVKEFSSLPFNQQTNQNETKLTDILAWLSQEPHFILHNIDLHYLGLNDQERFVTLYDLNFENSNDDHKISGKAILHQDLPTNITLDAQWTGSGVDINQIKGRSYIYVSGLSLSQWAKGIDWKGWQVKDGIVTAKIWATWNHGAFQTLQSAFESHGLALYSNSDKSTHNINRLSGNIGWKRQGTEQVFAGDDILLDLPSHLWPVTNFYMSLHPDANGNMVPGAANIGYVDLKDIQSFLLSAPELLPDSSKKILSDLKIRGELQNAAIVFTGAWNDWKHTSLNASFSKLSFLPWQQYPGANNLSGMIRWNDSQGELKLNSNKTVLINNTVFNNNVSLDQLDTDIQIQNDSHNEWLLNINSINFLNKDIAANLSGTLKIPSKASPVANLNANITMRKVSGLSSYLPVKIMDKELVEWLQQAFLSGEVESGHAVLRGRLKDFPFDKGNGEFNVSAKVKNIDFRFAPNWPSLKDLNGQVTFAGRKIIVDVDRANTLGIPLSKVHGVIPYLGDAHPQILEVNSSEIQTDFKQALTYVHISPLEKKLGKIFTDTEMRGPIVLKLGLSVPLSHPTDTKVVGDLAINNSVMNLAPYNLKLDNLNGNIKFTEDSIDAKNISGELFNKSLQFNLITKQESKNKSIVQASFTNKFDIADLGNWLKLPITKNITGTTNINGLIGFSLNGPLEINLKSDLVGATVDLVDQYGKSAKEARDFSANIIMQSDRPTRLKLNYGKLFSTAMIVERKQDKYNLVGANLRFGSGTADWPATSGIYITGQFDTLDWDQIKNYTNQSNSNSALSDVKLKEIDIRANKIKIADQTLTSVRLNVASDQDNWNINVNSPEIVGQIKVPVNFNRQSLITAQLHKIDFHSTANTSESKPFFDITKLPALSIFANDVRYNDKPLGQIMLKASPSDDGLNIHTLRIVSPRLQLNAVGHWKQSGDNYITHLKGIANSPQISNLLNSFGVDASNFVSSNGSLDFNLIWADAPYSPSLAHMNGRASLNMGSGRVVDIGADNNAKMDIGRMLSIFSLQTIPRRLTLDFSDIFEKGYSFDSLRGDFSIVDGSLNTNNLRFEGPVAQVAINGRIGLKNKDYNFILGVTPHVTSSIPVAATLLINPLVGLGALAVNEVIGSKISGATANYYAVTGPWNNPVWKSIRSGSRR